MTSTSTRTASILAEKAGLCCARPPEEHSSATTAIVSPRVTGADPVEKAATSPPASPPRCAPARRVPPPGIVVKIAVFGLKREQPVDRPQRAGAIAVAARELAERQQRRLRARCQRGGPIVRGGTPLRDCRVVPLLRRGTVRSNTVDLVSASSVTASRSAIAASACLPNCPSTRPSCSRASA